jgi:hypothetical protein
MLRFKGDGNQFGGMRPSPPVSNVERQRQFRERNPGYYKRLHAKRRAAVEELSAQRLAAAQATVVKREPLMLPAPVETIEIPGMTTIPSTIAMPAPEPLPVAKHAA